MSFASLPLSSALCATVKKLGFQQATSIQLATIPAVLDGDDVMASARTGSGKTAAYALPLLHRWQMADATRQPMSLILVPTRELAQQVSASLIALSEGLDAPKIVALYGGVSINPQLMDLRGGADFVVATPGRLLDVFENNGIDLSETSSLVLDEADRMLDHGFADELNAILGELPYRYQTLMFSATMPAKVKNLASKLLKQPRIIDIEEPIDTIEQRAIEVDARKRSALLIKLLADDKDAGALIFCASKKGAEALSQELEQHNIRVGALYGSLAQQRRDEVLAGLKTGEIKVVVATDLAARGIDVDCLPLVINYDLPRSPQVYTHRVGRTGRAGQSGVAISFIDADSQAHFKLIEKRTGILIPREQIPGFTPTDTPQPRMLVSDTNGGIKGKRMSKKDKLRAAAAKQAK